MKNCTLSDILIKPQPHIFAKLTSGLIPVPIFCSGGGRSFVTSTEYRWNGMARITDFSFWQYTISGGGFVEYNGQKTLVSPGKAMLLSAPEEHTYYFSRECGHWDNIYLCFGGTYHARMFKDIRIRFGSVIDVPAGAASLQMAAAWLKQLAAGKIISKYDSAIFASKFLMTLCSELDSTDVHKNRFDTKAKQLLNTTVCSVEDMRKTTVYSKEYFSRRFKKANGISPSRYIAESKLEKAVELLRCSDMSIADIATECGYTDAAYFCRIFNRKYNISPGKWRKKFVRE